MSFRHTATSYAGFFRILLTPLTFIYLTDHEFKKEALLCLVILTIISKIVDGYFCRKFNEVSNFGAFFDFITDKIFVCTTMIILSITIEVPLWITLVIINREFLVMGIRVFSASEGFIIPARIWGKLKTIVIFAAIVALLLNSQLNYLLFLIGVGLTTISFIDYTFIVVKYIRESAKIF
ncbi:MAG: CDP-diacylglycerol--glycerol-3-phosphate 3-phosphatidyltransferase [Bacteroidetes bacterium]|nr:MAG: CDP-diacylglycerol--glycerol-3-phosphate 3-phosphatidyltransferase [Bacteroidota bacterium]